MGTHGYKLERSRERNQPQNESEAGAKIRKTASNYLCRTKIISHLTFKNNTSQ